MQKLYEQYLSIARSYLASESEGDLYRASLLSRRFIQEELGPHELCQAHMLALDELCLEREPAAQTAVHRKLMSLLLEAIMVYAEHHQEVRKLVADLRRSKDELTEKTAQLVQTGKMTALGEMVASVSHELNQPLNAIVIICEDLLRDIQKQRLKPEGVESDLREVVSQVRKLADIVDHMRVFARKTAGTRLEPIEVAIPVEGVFKLMGAQLRIQSVEVSLELEPGLRVLGDPNRLEQVLMNLVTNARDAISDNDPAKGKRIAVRTFARTDAQGEPLVVIEIRDNGSGMPAEVLRSLFQPFFTTKDPGRGTGLGLHVSNLIVKEHRGTFEVESQEGVGTAFRVLLPAARE